jgi:hypothetical protein
MSATPRESRSDSAVGWIHHSAVVCPADPISDRLLVTFRIQRFGKRVSKPSGRGAPVSFVFGLSFTVRTVNGKSAGSEFHAP